MSNNKYYTNHSSKTGNGIIIGASLLSMALAYPNIDKLDIIKKNIPSPCYSVSHHNNTTQITDATYNKYYGLSYVEHDFIAENIENVVAGIYTKLLTSQKQLDSDFEQILYDNLWDLYES